MHRIFQTLLLALGFTILLGSGSTHGARTRRPQMPHPVPKNYDYVLMAADSIHVRVMTTPTEFDTKGNIKKFSPEELKQFKGDTPAEQKMIGYKGDFGNLRVGDKVVVYLSRPKPGVHPKSTSPSSPSPGSVKLKADPDKAKADPDKAKEDKDKAKEDKDKAKEDKDKAKEDKDKAKEDKDKAKEDKEETSAAKEEKEETVDKEDPKTLWASSSQMSGTITAVSDRSITLRISLMMLTMSRQKQNQQAATKITVGPERAQITTLVVTAQGPEPKQQKTPKKTK